MPRVLPLPRSNRPRQVRLGLEVWGGGVAGGVPSATAILTCKTQCFGKPHEKHRILVRKSDYQSIHAQAIMAFMFLSIPLPEHPCPNDNDFHVREHPVNRPSMPKPE